MPLSATRNTYLEVTQGLKSVRKHIYVEMTQYYTTVRKGFTKSTKKINWQLRLSLILTVFWITMMFLLDKRQVAYKKTFF